MIATSMMIGARILRAAHDIDHSEPSNWPLQPLHTIAGRREPLEGQ